MQYLRADTIQTVTVGPAVAVGDGFTPVTGLVGSSADAYEFIKNDATAVTTVGGTLTAITGADGYYSLPLSAAETDTEGRLTMLINDTSLILPIRLEFMVVNQNVFDSLFAVAGTDNLDVELLTATQASIDSIEATVDSLNLGIIYGVTEGTPSTTSTDTDLTGFLDGELVGGVIIYTGGTANGQRATILTYTETNGVVTFAALTTAPAASDPFKIV